METTQALQAHRHIVHEQLASIPQGLAAQLGGQILSLSHTSLVEEDRASDFGSGYKAVPTETYSPEQAMTHDRVGGLLGEVSRFVAEAHGTIQSDASGESGVADHKAVLLSARELALKEAAAAHEREESVVVKERLQTVVALSMIEGRGSGCDTQVRAAVAKGMGKEVVAAVSEMHGVVSVGGWFGLVSAPQVCGRTAALLQVATEQTFDDQFQHVELIAPEALSHIQTEILSSATKKLDARDLAALSKLEGDVRGDSVSAAMLAEKAGFALSKELLPQDFSVKEVKDVVQQIVRCRTEVTDDSARQKLTDSLNAVRASRIAGDGRYRNNKSFVYTIDAAMIEFAADGNREAVSALISSTRNEVLSAEQISQDPNAREVVRHAFNFIDPSYTEDDRARAHDVLLECHAQKTAALERRLLENGATEHTVNNILACTQDPDSAADVSAEFWRQYNAGGVNSSLITSIQGESARNIARTAADILVLSSAGLAPEDITAHILAKMSVLSADEQKDYSRSITEAMGVLQHWQANNPDVVVSKTFMRDLAQYDKPVALLKVWTQLDIKETEEISSLAHILRADRIDDYWQFGKIDSSKLEQIQTSILGGLPELLQQMPAIHKFDTIRATSRAGNGYDSFVQIKALMAEGLLELGGERNPIVMRHILRAENHQSEFTILKTLDKQGLFEVGGDKNNALVLGYILNSPDKQQTLKLIQELESQGLFELNDARNGLGVMGERMLMMCLQSENPSQMLRRINTVISGGQKSLWWLNTQYADLLLGEVKNGAMTEYMVSGIPIALPVASRAEYIDSDAIVMKQFADMTVQEKQMWIEPAMLAQNPSLALGSEIPFNSLLPESRSTLLAYKLFESIALSRSAEQLEQTTARNAAYAGRREPLELGDLVHSTASPKNLRNILISGMMCGETIGGSTQKDSYPYNVDTVVVSQEVVDAGDFVAQVEALKNQRYGSICLVMHRTPDSIDYGRETNGGMNADHRLVFGAIPATEINAVVLRSADKATQDEVVDSIVEHGMYVPIYDEEKTLLLTYEEYVKRREDGNYDAVRPEVVDGTFMLDGTQGGSNEGAWYIVPTTNGRERWYVKFGDTSPQKSKHLWTEILADTFYATVTPELVSETKPVLIDGRLARASREIILDETKPITEAARNEGFIMDCILGNWDAVYNDANLVMSQDGHAMRIDTGNSFDFRARGEYKDADSFGATVSEVEFGDNDKRLGGGMRQKYPGMTDDQIKQQVLDLQVRLPVEKIDQLIDSIRRPKAERNHLKEILKARRQYLIDTFLAE